MVRCVSYACLLSLASACGTVEPQAPSNAAPPEKHAVEAAPPSKPSLEADHDPAVIRIVNGTMSMGSLVIVSGLGDEFHGVRGNLKKGGQEGYLILPLSAALERAKAEGRLASGELGIEIDSELRYRTLDEVLFTAAESGITQIALRELRVDNPTGKISKSRSVHLDISHPWVVPPPRDAVFRPLERRDALRLLVVLGRDGVDVETSAGHASRDCAGFGRGLTLERHGDAFYPGILLACVNKLRARNPAFATEKSFQLETDREVWIRDVIGIVETLGPKSKGPFSEVVLHIGP